MLHLQGRKITYKQMSKNNTNDSMERLLQKRFGKFSLILFAMLFSVQVTFAQDIPTDEATIKQGGEMFKEMCVVCHNVDSKKIGPALQKVYDRKDLPWIIKFVQNSQKVIQSGDAYAVKLYSEYNNTAMSTFDYLSDEEVTSIVAYIKHETENPTVAAAAEVAEGEIAEVTENAGVPSSYMTAILVGLAIVLALILGILFLMVSMFNKFLKTKEGLTGDEKSFIDDRFSLLKLLKSPGFLGIIIFLFTAFAFKSTIDGLYNIGIQQGYQPTQPIAYSHKLHAGDLEIDCNYCHTGVTKAKNANIPSLNICMNCHSDVKNLQGKDGVSPEIQKIYTALGGYDPVTKEYGDGPKKPIEWTRVHNLPDLVYFNHKQHVKVGGLECQTCHGPIEEMEVVKQEENLTMGWCIDCHRKTDVNTQGNAYYDDMVKFHEKDHKDKMKVEDIGGLECSKCHY